jgi:pyrimidine operon attenuation protein/uracil phosphoribosyltransferase
MGKRVLDKINMDIGKIIKDYREQTGKQLPDEVDVIAILNSGFFLAQRVHEEFTRHEIKTRLLGLVPKNGGSRRIGRNSHEGIYRALKEKGKIPKNVSIQYFFSSNPEYRLLLLENKHREVATSKPDNLVVLAEDLVYFGGTLYSCLEDLDKLGYKGDKIYTCFERDNAESFWQMTELKKPFIEYQSFKGRKISD